MAEDSRQEELSVAMRCLQVDCKKVALVTGSGTGIGARIAVDLAAAGYRVIVTGRNMDNLRKIVDECKNAFNSEAYESNDKTRSEAAIAIRADLSDFRQVDDLINQVLQEFECLDVLVNNACYRGRKSSIISQDAAEDTREVLHINVSVPMYLVHKLMVPMASRRDRSSERPPPVVINISSIASQVVVPLHLYSISKACLSEMTNQLALRSQELGILAVTVSPGPILTSERPQHASMSSSTLLGRVGTPQEVSDFTLFVLENAHLFNGSELVLDGGYLAKQKQRS